MSNEEGLLSRLRASYTMDQVEEQLLDVLKGVTRVTKYAIDDNGQRRAYQVVEKTTAESVARGLIVAAKIGLSPIGNKGELVVAEKGSKLYQQFAPPTDERIIANGGKRDQVKTGGSENSA